MVVSNQPRRGMWLDPLPEEQPRETASYVMNGVTEGDHVFNYTNRKGTQEDFLAPYLPIGAITLPDDRRIIFSTDEIDSEIGIVTNGVYQTLINHRPLNFSKYHLIKANYRLINGCEFVIYYYDNFNPDRIIAIDQLDIHKNDAGLWDVNNMRLQALFSIPILSGFSVIPGGGNIEVGKYHFAIEVLDQNLNSLGFSRITQGVNIYEENTYKEITGDVNIIAFPNDGIAKVNKSISFQVDNIDGYFARVYVIQKTAGDGTTINVFAKSRLITVGSNKFSYTFKGISETDTRETLDKLIVGNAFYDKSIAQEIVDNRMVRAGVTEQAVDYTGFQRHANTYATTPIVKQIDAFTLEDAKSALDYQSGVGDEVNSLGVVFVFKQGFYSPAFHIPGRTSLPNETVDITITEELEHLGPIGSTVKAWQAYNFGTENQMGYYESSTTTYPTILDCNEEYVWGSLAGQPIRHHKLPSRRVIPVMEGDKVNLLGINIEKTEDYPHPDIVDHFYVVGLPTSLDHQVEDTGAILRRIGTLNYTATFNNFLWYNSSREKLGEFITGDYMKITNVYVPRLEADSDFPQGNDQQLGVDVQGSLVVYGNLLSGYVSLDWNSIIEESAFVQRRTSFSNTNTVTVPEFNDEIITYPNEHYRGYFIQNRRLFANFNDIPQTSMCYAVILRNRNVFDDLFAINYQRLDTGFELGAYVAPTTVSTAFGWPRIQDLTEILSTAQTFYTESRINPGLRLPDFLHVQDTDLDTRQAFNNYMIDLYFSGEDKRQQCKIDYWGYNPDYSFDLINQYYYPLPQTYRYCSKCLGEYPNRIVYSQVSFGEEIQDGFRVYRNDDYAHVGDSPITNLRYDQGRMIIHTQRSMYFQNPNPRTIQSDSDNIFLGTADFLSIPPAQIVRTIHGYAGCQGRHHLTGSEAGWFFVDQKRRSIFLLRGNQPEDLASPKYGMSRFFSRELPSYLSRQVPQYPHTDTPYGVGIIAAFDPDHNRYVLHKRDYEILNYGGLVTATTPYEQGKVYYKESEQVFLTALGNDVVPVELGNSRFFANKSWTISFSLDDMAWDSFHPFLPRYMHQDSSLLYSSVDEQVWSHDGVKGSIYGEDKPFIIEIIVNNPTSALLERILWYSRTENDQQVLDFPTFNSLIAYTEKQSTGLLTLVPPNAYDAPWNNTSKKVRKTKDYYTVSGLRNMAVGEPVFTDSWPAIQAQYPIDKVPTNIDLNKSQYNQEPIRGRAIRLRFIFNGSNTIVFNVSATHIKNTLR
jgi:hypothetical protein